MILGIFSLAYQPSKCLLYKNKHLFRLKECLYHLLSALWISLLSETASSPPPQVPRKVLERKCALGVTWSMSGPLSALLMGPDNWQGCGSCSNPEQGLSRPWEGPGSRPSHCALQIFSWSPLFFPWSKTPNCPAEGVSSLLLAFRPGFWRVLTPPRVVGSFSGNPERPENTHWLKWMPPESPLWLPSKFITCVALPPQPIFSQSLCY